MQNCCQDSEVAISKSAKVSQHRSFEISIAKAHQFLHDLKKLWAGKDDFLPIKDPQKDFNLVESFDS